MKAYDRSRPPGQRDQRMPTDDSFGMTGLWQVFCPIRNSTLQVMCGGGAALAELGIPEEQWWEHLSISVMRERRCPTWEEMDFIKDLWFDHHETVVQFHVPKSKHINDHPYVLHLWRKYDGSFDQPDFLPPPILV